MVTRFLCQERESGAAMSPGYCGTFKAVPVTLDDSLPEDVDVQILGRNHDLNRHIEINSVILYGCKS
jgi:hypothetical protein